MKKEMNKGSAKRLVIILSLCLALLIALGAFSFAWIRNYVDVDNVEITTGKMLYKFKLYRVVDGKVTSVPFLDTTTTPDFDKSNSEERLEKNLTENPLINIDVDEEVFFVIEKDPNSIDFDVALTFDNDGRPENFENIGQIEYKLINDSDALSDVVVSDKLSDADYQAALESYLNNPGDNTAKTEKLSNIWNVAQKASLEGGQKYAVIRLALSKAPGVSLDLENRSFPFRVSFCVAQKDALPDDENVDKFYVDNKDELADVMGKYGFNDEIYITDNIPDYNGDLVFTRPCKITLIRSTLTIHGNLVFSYMYGDKFELNTLSDGHINVLKNGSVDGNFQIDLPNTTIELIGANNDVNGKADIYVEGSFTANTSKNENEGLFFKGSRICEVTVADNTPVYSDTLKPILINGVARISISNRTRVGALSVNSNCRRFILENNGHIDDINLTKMTQDTTLLSTPAILIDNAGSVGVVGEDTNVIKLPEWSRKFNKDDIESAEDNTHIIANKGSGKILAITSNNTFEDSADVVNGGSFFFSLGDKNQDEYRDDIDYMLRTQFVEAINGDKTKIIVYYEEPSPNILRENQYKDLESLTNLKSYIDYYSDKGEIASAEALKEVTVICYGNKALTAPPLKNPDKPAQGYDSSVEYDYNFIKSMTSLTMLDLSDAVSVDKKVPDNAFKGMSTLTSIKMSESDTFWGKYIFTGTGIDEINFPQSLTELDNPKDDWGNITSQASLDGVRFIYTSITIVNGIYADGSAIQYYFVPDDFTCEQYRGKKNITEWHARIFLDNGVRRHGEYFLRYDSNNNDSSPTCEFVVFTGGVDLEKDTAGKTVEKRKPWVKEEGFDFNTVRIDDKVYTITSFDPYAFFNKLHNEDLFTIELGTNIKTIGKYAFACGSSISTTATGLYSVTIKGDPKIMGNAFAYNDALVEFNAPELTSLSGGFNLSNNIVLKTVYMPKLSIVEGAADLGNCPKLERVDIGVIEKDDINKNFYIAIKIDPNDQNKIENNMSAYEDYFCAKFYIHTEYANDVSLYTDALAADSRYIFVKESYAKLYRETDTYTGVVDMGENSLSELIAADVDGNDITSGKQPAYYYVIDGSNARLVACLLPEINKVGKDYTTISSFEHNGVTYPVTYIGSAAYHFTSMIAQNIKISNGVDKIGDYAFHSGKKAFKKYCVTLDVNDVVKAGSYAFYSMDMAKIVGNALEEVGDSTLSNNKNLIVANLPNLSRSRLASTNSDSVPPPIFVGCNKLRVSYVGYSNDISYDDDASLVKSYIRFINFVSGSEEIDIPKVNTVINNSYPNVDLEFTTNFVKTDKEFNGIYLSDYYEYEVELKGMSDVIELPGYVYRIQENGELSLIAVSPDLQIFGDYTRNENGGSDYTTPGKLYVSNGRYTAKNNGTDAKFIVTSLGKYAYGAVSVLGVDNFIIADSVTVLNDGALSGSACEENSDKPIITLFGIKCLDLANVTELGKQACLGANMTDLKASKLTVLGLESFLNCSSLKNAYLPAFAKAIERDTFKNCSSLEWITLGENAQKLVNNMFDGANKLQKITILNPNVIVTTGAGLRSKNPEKIIIAVPAVIYGAYEEAYKKSGFAKVPFENFTRFENATQVDGATYYWNTLDDSAKTAYIDYVEGTISNELTLPSAFGEYKVVAVSANAISSLPSNVSKIVLPDNMEYLTFNTADLTSGIKELEISSSNSKFKTVSGVLYSKDGKTLYVYPQSKSGTTFTVDSTVIEIAYRAFYGAKNIETLTIAGVVTVRDQAFEKADISTIKFTNTTASVFAGKDILLGANVSLRISVPSASLAKFKSNVLIDYSILDRFVGA